MNGDRAVKFVALGCENVWWCAPKRVMGRGIVSLMTPAVAFDQRSKKAATPMSAPSGRLPIGQG